MALLKVTGYLGADLGGCETGPRLARDVWGDEENAPSMSS